MLTRELALQYGAGGFVGRASGRAFDVRRAIPYAPYDALTFEVPVRTSGDVNERVWIRILEVGQSLALIRQIIDRLPQLHGELTADIHARRSATVSEGGALVEGFRGDIFAWVRIDRTRTCRALSSARPVVVSMAAARSGSGRQHRRRLSVVQ